MNTKNSNRINRISCLAQADGSIDIVVPSGMAEEFKLMIRKAVNCWPDQSAEIRDFVDRLLQRDQYMGSCMKESIYGHTPHGKWEVPSEDAYEIESTKQATKE